MRFVLCTVLLLTRLIYLTVRWRSAVMGHPRGGPVGALALSFRMIVRRFRMAPSVRGWCTSISAAALLAAAAGPAALSLGCGGAPQTAAARGTRAVEQPLPVPFDLREGIERAALLGTNLFLLDASTARAWDALVARIGETERAHIGHYLALLGANGEGRFDGSVQVLFFTDEHVPRMSYRVRVSGGPEHHSDVLEHDPPRLVHEPLMSLLNARLLALEALPPTTQAVNPVLIPQRDGQIVVYLLAATAEPHVAVLGRHYRVEVSEDGSEVEHVTALSQSELELPTRDGSGQRLGALAISDQVMEHPTETHVFASRMANVPIYVTTSRGRWKVRASVIDFLGPP